MEVLYEAHEGHDDSPRHHDGGEPAARAKFLEQQVAGDFKGRVSEEEDCQAEVVLRGREANVCGKALNVCVANIASYREKVRSERRGDLQVLRSRKDKR